jgi:SAM-dependent methyltransferase
MAPGSILQHMYVRSRVHQWPTNGRTFYEMGSGDGRLSAQLLNEGFTGRGFDLNETANAFNRQLNAEAISTGRYSVEDGSFIECEGLKPVDVVASMMVIEHLEAPLVDAYFRKARSLLKPSGRIVTLVPADMQAWGVEDEVAGHLKRYTRECFHELAKAHDMTIVDLAGLTWPLSNLLLPVSNYLVSRAEAPLLSKSMHERTVASGHREVQFKTTFPWWTRLLLNPVAMLPWHALQRLGRNSERSLVLYCEMTAPSQNPNCPL